MLEDLPALAAKAKLSEQAAEVAKIAIGELEECFGKLDEALHAAEGQGDSPAEVHASLKDRIEAALKSLEETKE
jgi:predicted RNase H-like HicB family nuclease